MFILFLGIKIESLILNKSKLYFCIGATLCTIKCAAVKLFVLSSLENGINVTH